MMIRSRRDILKGLSFGAGGALLTPFMHQIKLQAEGNSAALPKRFVFVVKSSGVSPEGITPESLQGEAAGDNGFSTSPCWQGRPPFPIVDPARVAGVRGSCRGWALVVESARGCPEV